MSEYMNKYSGTDSIMQIILKANWLTIFTPAAQSMVGLLEVMRE